MEFEPALSRSAQPARREAILRRALLGRRAELRRSWRGLITRDCLEPMGELGREVEEFLSGDGGCRDWRPVAHFNWMICDANFADSLRAIALAGEIEVRPLETAPAAWSRGELNKLQAGERLRALSARYRCPLNIGTASEFGIAEELLRQLMVSDRAKLEADAEVEVDLVLLKLILVGIRAMITRDLRSLDALNYFYELPRQSLKRLRAKPPFLAFWLCIYAQLLCAPDW